jgi:hypothetical protein
MSFNQDLGKNDFLLQKNYHLVRFAGGKAEVLGLFDKNRSSGLFLIICAAGRSGRIHQGKKLHGTL